MYELSGLVTWKYKASIITNNKVIVFLFELTARKLNIKWWLVVTSTSLPHSTTSIVQRRASPNGDATPEMLSCDCRKVCWFTVPPQTCTRGTANCRSNLSNSSVTRNNSNFLLGVYDSLVQHNAIRIRLVSPLPWLRSHCPAWKLGRKVVSSGKVPHAWIDYLHMGSGKLSENDWFLLVFVCRIGAYFNPSDAVVTVYDFYFQKHVFLNFKSDLL